MLPNFLRPYHIDDQKLVRVGPKLDGGYVIDKKSILNTDVIIACGLNDDWEFEKFFLKINTKCIVEAYDHTIDKKFWIERFKKDIKHFFLSLPVRSLTFNPFLIIFIKPPVPMKLFSSALYFLIL